MKDGLKEKALAPNDRKGKGRKLSGRLKTPDKIIGSVS